MTAGKSGGGFQGRETKTKSTKKKYLGRDKDDADSDEGDSVTQNESTDTVFMSCAEIADELRRQSSLADCSPEFIDAVASHLYRYVYIAVELCSYTTAAFHLVFSGTTVLWTQPSFARVAPNILCDMSVASELAADCNRIIVPQWSKWSFISWLTSIRTRDVHCRHATTVSSLHSFYLFLIILTLGACYRLATAEGLQAVTVKPTAFWFDG